MVSDDSRLALVLPPLASSSWSPAKATGRVVSRSRRQIHRLVTREVPVQSIDADRGVELVGGPHASSDFCRSVACR